MLLTVGMPSSSMRCLKMSSERASDSPTDPLRRRSSATPKSISMPGGGERDADVPDTGARRHAGHVGDGQDLCGGAVEAGAGRPDPHADRHGCVGDELEQFFDLVVGDDGAAAVDLQDQGLRPLVVGSIDRRLDTRRAGSDRRARSPATHRPGRHRSSSSSAVARRSRRWSCTVVSGVSSPWASATEPNIVMPARVASMPIASLRKGASGERDLAAIVDRRTSRRGGGQGGCGEDHGNGCDRPCGIPIRAPCARRRTRREADVGRAGARTSRSWRSPRPKRSTSTCANTGSGRIATG